MLFNIRIRQFNESLDLFYRITTEKVALVRYCKHWPPLLEGVGRVPTSCSKGSSVWGTRFCLSPLNDSLLLNSFISTAAGGAARIAEAPHAASLIIYEARRVYCLHLKFF